MGSMARILTMVSVSLLVVGLGASQSLNTTHIDDVCHEIESSISVNSAVFWPGEDGYAKDLAHWADSASQPARCTVEPGSAQDVGTIIRLISKNRTPFSVKGGGHTANPGFSSSPGIQIAMSRFSEVRYNSQTQTATVGSGLAWDEVYAALEKYGVSVIGGRVSGVGVAGLTLGGGYSYFSQQRGLAVDNVAGFELIKPNGQAINVTASSEPELFFGLRGGLNNFGIVTRFTLRTHLQGSIWGGVIVYAGSEGLMSDVRIATQHFVENVQDPKAVAIPTFTYGSNSTSIILTVFYDGATPPAEIFKEFLALPSVSRDVKTRSLYDLLQSVQFPSVPGARVRFNTFPLVKYSSRMIEALWNETTFWGSHLPLNDDISVVQYTIEPFQRSTFAHGQNTAYPPASARLKGLQPSVLSYGWSKELSAAGYDIQFDNAIRQSAIHLRNLAASEGQNVKSNAPVYPNYAIFDTPREELYGENLGRLVRLKRTVDPGNTMGLTGGFIF